MKDETKNEMDLLLRRLGRRDETSVSNAAASHLDTDELSAYAENALPAAARSRYTAHLAECSRCRDLVVQLSSSTSVVAATDVAKVSGPSGWKKFFASLFTPMVLRYAAPALGLIVVAVIGFVVLRRDQPARSVAELTNNKQDSAARALATASPDSISDSITKPTPSVEGFTGKVENKQAEQPARVAAPPPNAPPAVNVESEVSKDKAPAQPKPAEQTASANEAPPPPKTQPAATAEETQKTADAEAKKESRGVAAAAPGPVPAEKDLRVQQPAETKNTNFARDDNRKAEPSDRVSGLMAGSAATRKRSEADVSANTRTVAGRRFQKKGGVWIDTAYDSSKDSVTLARDSEQYRALIADEPQIKTIADTLEGEILVVWKGHTYRIR
jgi:hypothetical protein